MGSGRLLAMLAALAVIGVAIVIFLFAFDSGDGDERAEAAISAGASHGCALSAGGAVECWGLNRTGQLGTDAVGESALPVSVTNMDRSVVAVTAGGSHSCSIILGGGARCWGGNSFGQLGYGFSGIQTSTPIPVDVTGLGQDVIEIAAGADHTCALTEDGAVQCWGRNMDGRLGDGTTDDRPEPVQVSGLDGDVTAVTAGSTHSCALMDDGDAFCWGGNFAGQLGNGTMTDSATPVQVEGLSDVVAISAGSTHTCAVTEDGNAFCWGSNVDGRLGNDTTIDSATPTVVLKPADAKIVAVSAGFTHTCALSDSGGVTCWGGNASGQLGNRGTEGSITPVNVSGLTNGAVAVSSGGFYACALTADGRVLCWGESDSGQAGLEATETCGVDARAVTCTTTPANVLRLAD